MYAAPLELREVLDAAVTAVKRDSAKLILIDPWNELERAKRKDQLLTDYIAEVLMYLRQFARQYSVAVVMIAHPTKTIFDKGQARVPNLYDSAGRVGKAFFSFDSASERFVPQHGAVT